MQNSHVNWAGNIAYRSTENIAPRSIAQVQEIVANSHRVKALGTRHCFNTIADTEGAHLSLNNLNRILSIDTANKTVTIEGGVRYGELGIYLHERGYALANLASLPHINVAGAVATGTHGSGIANQNLAASVRSLSIVQANGELVAYSRQTHPELFAAFPVNLGAFGIVVQLTLEIEPTYSVRQDLYQNLSLASCLEAFEPILGSAYSVSLFTDWKSDSFHQVWLKNRIDQAPDFSPPHSFYGATRATENHHPLPDHSAKHCTEQCGKPGPWHERLPHFRLEFTPSSGEELQTEYFIQRSRAPEAIKALFSLRTEIVPHVFVTEIRAVAADDLWLSPAYQQDCVGIHFTWKPDWQNVSQLLPKLERILSPFSPRPHWGKCYTLKPESIAPLYPRFNDFISLAKKLDPDGKFQNAYLAPFS